MLRLRARPARHPSSGQHWWAARSREVLVELPAGGRVVVVEAGSVLAVVDVEVEVDGAASLRTPVHPVPVTSSMPSDPGSGWRVAPPSIHRASRSAAARWAGG